MPTITAIIARNLALGAVLALAQGCRITENASSDPASIAGRIVSASGHVPASGAHVDLTVHDSPRAATIADGKGVFVIDGLHEAPYDLHFEDGDREAVRCVDLRGGENIEIGDVLLCRRVVVEGRVTRGGAPLQGLLVGCFEDEADGLTTTYESLAAVPTDAEGRFVLGERLGTRALLVVWPAEDKAQNGPAWGFPVDMPDGGVLELDLRIDAAPRSVRDIHDMAAVLGPDWPRGGRE